jgi:hypothetical protein
LVTFILKRHLVSRPFRALDLTAFMPYMQLVSLTSGTFRQITVMALRALRRIASFPFRATSCNCKNVTLIDEMNLGILLSLQHQDNCNFLSPLILHKLIFSIFFELIISRL